MTLTRCAICNRVMPKSAEGDTQAASRTHCSPYEWSIDPTTGAPTSNMDRAYTTSERTAHEAWLRSSEGQQYMKAERTRSRVMGEAKDQRIDAFTEGPA